MTLSYKKLFSNLLSGLFFSMVGAIHLSAAEYTIKQITDNLYDDSRFVNSAPLIDNGQITWIAQVISPTNGRVFLYDGNKILQLTDTPYSAFHHQIHNGQVVWSEQVSPSREIFLYDGQQVVRLTDDYDYNDTAADIHNGRISWIRSRTFYATGEVKYEISVYDDNQTKQIFSSPWPIFDLDMHNNQIVWYGFNDINRLQIYFYDGITVTQLTNSHPSKEKGIEIQTPSIVFKARSEDIAGNTAIGDLEFAADRH